MAIISRLDRAMAERKITTAALAEMTGLDQSNISRLKSGKIKAVRFSTLDALCQVLSCETGDIIEFIPDEEARALFGDEYMDSCKNV